MKILVLILSILVVIGCNTPVAVQEIKTFSNEANLAFSIDNVSYVGMAAIPRKRTQIIKFNVGKSAERIVISTCHGAVTTINPPNPFVFEYYPVHLIEDTVDICPLKAEVASKDAPLALAVIDFYGDEVSMPSWVTCNRLSTRAGGASVCQAPVGLIQRITFDEAVMAEPDDACNKIECDGGNCTFRVAPKYCTYIFKGFKTEKYHRILVRGLAAMEN
jgi:hypothetical protein